MSATRHEEVSVSAAVGADRLFAWLDDPARLGGHMTKPSFMMLGGGMTYAVDDRGGSAVGSVIRMSGTILGLRLDVEEVVTEHVTPRRKVWETRGPQRMIVIESYRMGFEVEDEGDEARARIFIDYVPARAGFTRLLGALLARPYARWCVRRMAQDAREHFTTQLVGLM